MGLGKAEKIFYQLPTLNLATAIIIHDLRLRPHRRGRRHAVEDYYPQANVGRFRLHEKGGERHKMPAP
jgi:hypothetical protein